VKITYWI